MFQNKGMTYFIIDIHQPGVEVVLLRQMNGHASFNQVFFTDAEIRLNSWSEIWVTVEGRDYDPDARTPW